MRTLGWLSRSFQAPSPNTLRVLYLTMVCSTLTFGTPAWHPTSVCNLEKLERVQGRATRLILGCKGADREVAPMRLSRCNLPPISSYLDKADHKFLVKCLSGASDFQFFREDRVSVRSRREGLRGDGVLLTYPRGTSNAYLSSLIPRCVDTFNRLPEASRRALLPV